MTRELVYAFSQLRISERNAVLKDLNYSMQQAIHETGGDFIKRALRQVSSDGMIRELESAMRRFQ